MAAGSLQRQNTVNMLDPLPDIDFFSLPVDDFFDSYVSELGAQGSNAPSLRHLLRDAGFAGLCRHAQATCRPPAWCNKLTPACLRLWLPAGQPSQPYASIFGPQDTSSTGAPALPNASKPSTPLAPFMPAQQPSSDTPLPLPGSASTAFPDLPLDNNVRQSSAL